MKSIDKPREKNKDKEHCLTKGKRRLRCRMIVLREEVKEGKPHKKLLRLF